jgi:hypothetical protein
MRKGLMAASLMVLASTPARAAEPAQQAAPGTPIVQVGLFGYRADGKGGSAALMSEPAALVSVVYASFEPCRIGVRPNDAPADADHAWSFSASIVEKTPDYATIQIRWRRMVEMRQPVNTADQSVQLTIRAGERVALDSVLPEPSCNINSFAFEARYMPHAFGAGPGRTSGGGPVGSGSFRGSGGARAGGGAGSGGYGAGTGSGGGAGSGAGAGAGSGTGGGSGSGSESGAGSSGVGGIRQATEDVRAGKDPDTRAGRSVVSRRFVVNLWLVHHAPGRPERVQQQVLVAPAEGADFAFAPVSIDLPRGTASVQVSGSLSMTKDDQLVFATQRRVTYPQQPPRDVPDQGRGQITNPMPAPGEVLSIELPPIRAASGGGALPDRFEVRVRFNQ